MPVNPEAETQATRQMYIDRILECQLPDGGWSLFGGTDAAGSGDGVSDPDITGMALQALAKYQDQPAVAEATEEALVCMSEKQSADGGFASWGTANSESVVQMIVALCELGISLDDPRFVKNGNTMLDNLMTFYLPGEGFLHTQNGSGSNQMATEQGFTAWWPPSGPGRGETASTACPTPSPSPTLWRQRRAGRAWREGPRRDRPTEAGCVFLPDRHHRKSALS